MGEQDAMAVTRSQDPTRDVEPGRLIRLWPEIDVYGRLRRLIAAEGAGAGLLARSRSEHPAA
jgi:hypothetical protein